MPLSDYLPENDNRPDQFEFGGGKIGFSFPCCVCVHRERDESECLGCAHCLN